LLLLSYTDLITNIVTKACIKSLPKKVEDFDVEFVRVAKILGGTIHDSFFMNGIVV